ncbi:MAG: hypothetical protein J1E41_00540 [Ruminococcus sp.]|nr:hypothetical protein [Ruminococcus sp.]
MSSCTQVVKNTADEIRLNTWSARLKSESMVTLKFKEDIASFKVTSSDKKPDLKLSGLCIIDSKNIMIFDDSDNQNYVFSYKLKENKLILGYNSVKLTLKRK